MRLDGKAVLITGASSGIGRALAAEAARRGASLWLVGRRPAALEETRRKLPPGAKVHCIAADVATAEGRRAIRRAVTDDGGVLDILVNNAGCITKGPFAEISDEETLRMLHTNLAAPALLTRDLLAPLRRAPRGRVVNIGSVYGDIAAPAYAVYAATKFGLRGLSDALRRELAPEGIGVTYAAPRATNTEGVQAFAAELKRQGNPLDEPAKVAAWIWNAVERERRSVYPPSGERLFVFLQRIFPAVIDRALAKRRDTAARESQNAGGAETI